MDANTDPTQTVTSETVAVAQTVPVNPANPTAANPTNPTDPTAATTDPAESIDPTLIIGTGLVGASIGQALRAAGVEVYLRDINRSNAVVAASRGAGMVASPRPSSVHLVVVAVPPAVTAEVVMGALEEFPLAAVIDVASVKSQIVETVATLSPHSSRFVGSHPMAGSQHAGPLTAVGELFVDRTWVITPTQTSDSWAVSRAEALIAVCRAREKRLDAATHDRAVAAVSHLPQLMSSLVAARLAETQPDDLTLAGQGVRDVTRIAASDAQLWAQIVSGNRERVRSQLLAVQDDLAMLIAGLDTPDTVAALVERGNAGVAALPGKHGRALVDLVVVTVEIPDTPGALARLFREVDEQGINVEDLSIEHDAIRLVGFLSIHVEPERADNLRESLRDNGWEIRA
jgi:prephenate dehydrogenase